MGMKATGRCTGHKPKNPSGATPMMVQSVGPICSVDPSASRRPP